MVFENRLIFPPVPRPRRILECGSGSGAWAIEVAEQYPECEVRMACFVSGVAYPSGVSGENLSTVTDDSFGTCRRIHGKTPD